MAAEHDKHMVHKDLEAKDEEMEQLRYNMQKKVNPSIFLTGFVLYLSFLSFLIAEVDSTVNVVSIIATVY